MSGWQNLGLGAVASNSLKASVENPRGRVEKLSPKKSLEHA